MVPVPMHVDILGLLKYVFSFTFGPSRVLDKGPRMKTRTVNMDHVMQLSIDEDTICYLRYDQTGDLCILLPRIT